MPDDDILPSVFEQLLEFKWRHVSFPVSRFSTAIHQDHVQHKWPDRDGAHVEGTGRAPTQIRATALFRNGIAPGKAEKWGVLYPTGFREFLVACADRTSGTLQHPELGNITCKVETCDVQWDSGRRDGVDVDVSWIESNDTTQDLAEALAQTSPIATTLQFAADLDEQIIQINPALKSTTEPSFLDSVRELQGVFDQATLLAKKTVGQIDRVLYRIDSLQSSILGIKDATTWPAIQSIERLRASLFGVKKTLLVATKDIRFYIARDNTTFSMLATTLQAKVQDLINLNPSLTNSVSIPRGTPVRYYGV